MNGETGVLALKSAKDRIVYLFDNYFTEKSLVKIDKFSLDNSQNHIVVMYRIGRQKLINKSSLIQFSEKYYDSITTYDKQRLAKFFVYESLLSETFTDGKPRSLLIQRIEKEFKNEQLF